jgi:hypothetical protein
MPTYDRFSTQLAVLYMMDGLLFTTEEDTSLDKSEKNEVPVEFENNLNSDIVTDEEDMNNELKQIEGDTKNELEQIEYNLKSEIEQDPDSVADFPLKGGKKRRRSKKNRRK